jgi:V/A-type H+-transporting ATPase subunit C
MSTKFASAVATVRSMENSLLNESDISRMISAADFRELADVLTSKGRTVAETREKMSAAIDSELKSVWETIRELTGNKTDGLEILLYKNDFHNLKASLKSLITNENPQNFYIEPTNLSLDELHAAVSSKNFDRLPDYMADTAADAYELLTRTLDGQLADAVIDRAAFRSMIDAAEKTGEDILIEYARTSTAYADIKTAYRCSIIGKSEEFMRLALCGSEELDSYSMIRAAAGGRESFLNFLDNTPFQEAAGFEKLCDDVIIDIIGRAKMTCFGISPLAAYYLAKETEIKNIRIIMVCKSCGASEKTITERMRKLYV